MFTRIRVLTRVTIITINKLYAHAYDERCSCTKIIDVGVLFTKKSTPRESVFIPVRTHTTYGVWRDTSGTVRGRKQNVSVFEKTGCKCTLFRRVIIVHRRKNEKQKPSVAINRRSRFACVRKYFWIAASRVGTDGASSHCERSTGAHDDTVDGVARSSSAVLPVCRESEKNRTASRCRARVKSVVETVEQRLRNVSTALSAGPAGGLFTFIFPSF